MENINDNLMSVHSLGYYLDKALKCMINEVNHLLKVNNINLQHSQFSIMLYLDKNEGLSQTELASLIEKNPSAIFRSINYLENKGYVVRLARNGCKNMLFLTDCGRELLPQLKEIARSVTAKAVEGMSEEEERMLFTLLYKLTCSFSRR